MPCEIIVSKETPFDNKREHLNYNERLELQKHLSYVLEKKYHENMYIP